jgi:hypothetical protein
VVAPVVGRLGGVTHLGKGKPPVVAPISEMHLNPLPRAGKGQGNIPLDRPHPSPFTDPMEQI